MSAVPCQEGEWKDLPQRPNGTTPYQPNQEMSLLHEMAKMPDCDPSYLHGGGQKQPWIVPVYGMSAEVELADALYALVRLLKPRVVVETGCHLGFTSWALGRAVRDNRNGGTVTTCDIDPECVRKTRHRCNKLPVTVLEQSATSDIMRGWLEDADFVFLDADENTRPPCFEMVKTGAIVLIHDTNQEPEILDGIHQTAQRIDFTETWRGVSLFRKME